MWMSVQGYMEREPKNMGRGDSGHNKRQNFLTNAAAILPWNKMAPPPSQKAFTPSEVASFLAHLRAS